MAAITDAKQTPALALTNTTADPPLYSVLVARKGLMCFKAYRLFGDDESCQRPIWGVAIDVLIGVVLFVRAMFASRATIAAENRALCHQLSVLQ